MNSLRFPGTNITVTVHSFFTVSVFDLCVTSLPLSLAASVAELRSKVAVEHEQVKQKEHVPKASYGYGGKFGVEKDRMDKVQLSIHCLIAFLSFIL